jgi:hypothetical protein
MTAMMLLIVSMAFPLIASHYRLSSLDRFTETELDALSAQNIQTTEDFLRATLNRESRELLSQNTQIDEINILVFSRLCELLQIEGVGPKAAHLLRAAGVVSLNDLIGRNPATLTETVGQVNAAEQITGINPSVENLTTWIENANRAPYRLE